MTIHFAAMAVNGPNDPSKALKCADLHPPLRGTFADAKAAVVVRAEFLRVHLAATGCRYRMHSSSSDDHYEISFEYGTKSDRDGRPFKVAFRVYAFVNDQELLGDFGH